MMQYLKKLDWNFPNWWHKFRKPKTIRKLNTKKSITRRGQSNLWKSETKGTILNAVYETGIVTSKYQLSTDFSTIEENQLKTYIFGWKDSIF